MTTQEWKFTAKDIANKPDLFLSGHRACAGCGPAAVLRMIMKATRGPTIVTQATGCMEIVGSIYPYSSWALPWLHTAFENAAANASGIDAAIKATAEKRQNQTRTHRHYRHSRRRRNLRHRLASIVRRSGTWTRLSLRPLRQRRIHEHWNPTKQLNPTRRINNHNSRRLQLTRANSKRKNPSPKSC